MSPALRHPAAVLALATWIVNDHWAKAQYPGAVTGKLSDVAGLLVFPLLLVAILDAPRWLLGRADDSPVRSHERRLLACIVATGACFSAINLWPAAAQAWAWGLGAGQWVLAGLPARGPIPASVTLDPTDLAALPCLGLAWLIGSRHARRCASRTAAHPPGGEARLIPDESW